ncbi:PTS sugar transporter subunit IIC [Mycoplasma elephantis]|uniref:PTS sugar transporter subunit IIC n=1 Tax=Mycoplasma elephantis TaxID=114882 RepID=UPI00068A0A85|nr:PTS transporter subunit EIIC [Mycoplasma elephantis]
MSSNQKVKKTSVGMNILKWIERTFMPIISKISDNRYINAIRNGMVAVIPILLIGSMFLILFFFPIGKSETLGINVLLPIDGGRWARFFMLPYRLTFPMMGFFVVIGIARSLARNYKLDDQQGVFIALIAYLISIVGPTYSSIGNPAFTSGSFGSATIFGGIIVSIISIEIFRLCIKYRIMIRLPKSVPEVVAKPFNAIIPMLFVMVPAVLLFNVLKFDIHKFASLLLQPIQGLVAGNNFFGFIVVILFVMLLWIAGIHGMAIVGAVARPFWLIAIDDNLSLTETLGRKSITAADGANILVEPFFQWFVWIGGAGATLGLLIVMLFIAKSKYIRAITYPSIVPGIFNINEPVIFGYPLVLNPILAIPAILAPLTMGTLSFIAMKLNLVNVPIIVVGWTLPSPVGAVLATNLDWRALVLCLLMIAVSCVIWWPFAKMYDNVLLKQEIEEEVQLRKENAEKENIIFNEEETRAQVSKEFHSRSIFKRNKKQVKNIEA